MLAIEALANSNQPSGINNDFVVDTVEILANDCFLIWFSRGAANADTHTNFTISGGRTVRLAQYQSEVINGSALDTRRGVRIYFDSPLVPGQWTLTCSSNIVSNDAEAVALPADTTLLLDLTEVVEDGTDDSVADSNVSKYVPAKYRAMPVIAALIEANEVCDRDIADQARLSFDQQFITTASGEYLESKARDTGVEKPNKLGISDQDFRKLVVNVVNNKFTEQAFLDVLEVFYGPDACRGKVETAGTGPFRVMDGGTLEFVFDNKTVSRFIADKNDFAVSVRATGPELVAALNQSFDKDRAPAYAVILDTGKVAVYSKTTGLRSSVAVTGGTLQPELQFGASVFGAFTTVAPSNLQWELSSPRNGVVRFSEISGNVNFTNPVLKAGSYVVITGNEFPEEIRGSYRVITVNRSYVGAVLTQWFEIESNYVPS